METYYNSPGPDISAVQAQKSRSASVRAGTRSQESVRNRDEGTQPAESQRPLHDSSKGACKGNKCKVLYFVRRSAIQKFKIWAEWLINPCLENAIFIKIVI